MKTVCVVTSTRADYGLLRPLLFRLREADDLELRLVATGMHLCPEFGDTIREIETDPFPVHRRIEIQLSGDAPAAMSKTMGMALIAFADYFRDFPPDLLVLLGDRHETLAVCCAAVNQRVPVAHIHGGEITEGAVDNGFRHAISKMSSLHFTAAPEYRRRVVQMGEAPETVFNVGALAIENIVATAKMSMEELSENLGFALRERKYAVVTFHPVTLEDGTGPEQVRELTAAMDRFPELRFIVTKANSDAGGRAINQAWKEYAGERDNCLVVDSLGSGRYLSALKYAAMMIGNSSSGLVEGPASGIPTVNIGDRQKGRLRPGSVIDCPPERDGIAAAMASALTPQARRRAEEAGSFFGVGEASEKIAETLRAALRRGPVPVEKAFYDLPQ